MASAMDRQGSAAWAALSAASRKMLIVIEQAIAERGTREVELAFSHFLDAPPELAISRPVIRHCVRRLEALGFVTVRLGAKRVNVFALSQEFWSVDKTSAKRRLARAKAAKPKPAPRQLQLGQALGPSQQEGRRRSPCSNLRCDSSRA